MMPCVNLASDVILSCYGVPVLRVSTATWEWEDADMYGGVKQVETWIFSDLAGFKSRQRVWEFWRQEHALKFHARIVRILRQKFANYLV